MKSHAPCHPHEILLNSVLTIEEYFLATTTFRPIPAGRPTEAVPCSAGNSNWG